MESVPAGTPTTEALCRGRRRGIDGHPTTALSWVATTHRVPASCQRTRPVEFGCPQTGSNRSAYHLGIGRWNVFVQVRRPTLTDPGWVVGTALLDMLTEGLTRDRGRELSPRLWSSLPSVETHSSAGCCDLSPNQPGCPGLDSSWEGDCVGPNSDSATEAFALANAFMICTATTPRTAPTGTAIKR